MNGLDFHTKIAGVTFSNEDGVSRQDIIEDLEERWRDTGEEALELRRDHHNAYDKNAVTVLDSSGRQLGFLSGQVAETIAPLLDRGVDVRVSLSSVTGGGLTQNYGVNVRIWTP